MSRRPVIESPIPLFLQSETDEQARQAINSASIDDIEDLQQLIDDLNIDEANSKINELDTDLNALKTEVHTTIPVQRIMGNPGSTPVKSAPIDLDDGGLIINQSTGKIYVGDTYGKILYWNASRSDGKNGTGTLASPLNASTPARIDAIMTPLYNAKTPVNIMLIPGADYRINPIDIMNVHPVANGVFAPWYLYNGLRIKGFGKGRTVIKPRVNLHNSGNTKCRFSIFRSSFKPEDGEFMFYGGIEDLTIDGEVTTNALPGTDTAAYTAAYDCAGDEVSVLNVHFTRLGGRGQEMFPVILRNGFKSGSIYIPERTCNLLVRGCSTKQMYHSGQGIGFLINGSVERASNIHQRFLATENTMEDCYITWVDFNNFKATWNRMSSSPGQGIYAAFNCDTGINRGVQIFHNDCLGVIASGIATGGVTMGNWLSLTLGVMISDIEIGHNLFSMFPNLQSLYKPGVIFNGNCINWNIHDNWYKQGYTATHFSKRGFISNKGTGNAAPPTTDGAGFGNAWDLTKNGANTSPYSAIAGGGPQQANSEGIMLNNKLIEQDVDGNYTADHGKTPEGMDNHLMSALT